MMVYCILATLMYKKGCRCHWGENATIFCCYTTFKSVSLIKKLGLLICAYVFGVRDGMFTEDIYKQCLLFGQR